jgi:predicted PurR-regulated permease PerM
MNFIPYLGAAVVIVLLFGVGIMAFDSLAYALIAPVFYLIVSTLEGQFITPGIVGLRLALSPLLVFLAVAFWTWFWGPFGALLAVPLLIIGMVALNHAFPKETVNCPIDGSRWNSPPIRALFAMNTHSQGFVMAEVQKNARVTAAISRARKWIARSSA